MPTPTPPPRGQRPAAQDIADDADGIAKSYAATFSDVPASHWASLYVEELAAARIIDGYPQQDGARAYIPEGDITRAEMMKLIAAALKLPLEPGYDGSAFSDWNDVAVWARPYVGALAKAGIVRGSKVNGGIYVLAEDKISRQEMIAMVVRALGVDSTAGATVPAADSADVAPWARDDVAFAMSNGMLNYRSGEPPAGYVLPLSDATRAEAAMMLFKLLRYLDE